MYTSNALFTKENTTIQKLKFQSLKDNRVKSWWMLSYILLSACVHTKMNACTKAHRDLHKGSILCRRDWECGLGQSDCPSVKDHICHLLAVLSLVNSFMSLGSFLHPNPVNQGWYRWDWEELLYIKYMYIKYIYIYISEPMPFLQ